MTKAKRIKSAAAGLAIVALIAAGCSGKPDSSASPKPAQNGGTANGVTEISMVVYSNYEKAIKKAVEDFEKEHSNIKVKLISSPFSQMMETIEIKMNSKSDDLDVLFVDSPLTPNYTLKNYLEPLDQLLGVNPKEMWVQSSIDSASYNGKLMAAPMNSSSQVLYFNKDIFQQKGVPLPDPNMRMTWEQLVDIAKKLTYDTNGDAQPDVYGFSFDQIGRAYQLLPLSDSLGAKMLSDDGLTSAGYTNSPEAVQAFQFYGDLFNKHKVSPRIKKEEAIDYFTSGKVAMFLAANHSLPKIKDSKLNFGVTLHPYFEGKKIATPTGAWNIGISKYSKKKEAAAEFVKYLTADKRGAKTVFELAGTLPASLELLNEIDSDPKYANFPDNVIRIASKEARETAVLRPKSPGYLDWETNMNKAFEDIKHGSDVKKTLDTVVNQIDNQLKKYKSAVK